VRSGRRGGEHGSTVNGIGRGFQSEHAWQPRELGEEPGDGFLRVLRVRPCCD
jgi:hypothetical protein